MLFRMVAVFIFVLVVTSALANIRVQRQRHRDAFDVKLIARRRTQGLITAIVFWVSIGALLFFITGFFTPVEILLLLVFSLLIPCSAILVSTLLFDERSGPPACSIARDRATGEEIGLVVGQVNEPQSDRVKSYKIRNKDGELIEKTVDSIMIEVH